MLKNITSSTTTALLDTQLCNGKNFLEEKGKSEQNMRAQLQNFRAHVARRHHRRRCTSSNESEKSFSFLFLIRHRIVTDLTGYQCGLNERKHS